MTWSIPVVYVLERSLLILVLAENDCLLKHVLALCLLLLHDISSRAYLSTLSRQMQRLGCSIDELMRNDIATLNSSFVKCSLVLHWSGFMDWIDQKSGFIYVLFYELIFAQNTVRKINHSIGVIIPYARITTFSWFDWNVRDRKKFSIMLRK